MSFTAEKAKQKLAQVNNTQQSIQSTSQWCLFHYRHFHEIVSLWRDAFINPDAAIDQSESNYRLALFYLCNDVVQFAKKKEEKYAQVLVDFSKIMPQIISFIAHDSMSTHLKPKYMRVLDVWKDRFIYSPEVIGKLHATLNSVDASKQHGQHKLNNPHSQQQRIPGQSRQSQKQQQQQHQAHRDTNNVVQDGSNLYQQNNLMTSNVPQELVSCVDNFTKLDNLYKSYKKNFTDFNKVSNSILSGTSNSTGEKETQLNNLLSSLSSLGNNNKSTQSEFDNNSNSNQQVDDSVDVSKFNKIENLGSQISNQFKQISSLRTELSREFRRIAQELDDWMMLDKNKQSQIESTLVKLKDKKSSIIEESEKVSVFNYDNADDDEENIPKYDNQNDSDSDDNRGRNSDSDSDDDDNDQDEYNNNDNENRSSNKTTNTEYTGTAIQLAEESDKEEASSGDDLGKPSSSLRKRLLNEDGDQDTKRSKKSVTFSDKNETLVFDSNDIAQIQAEMATNILDNGSSETSAESGETGENSDNDLTALLGLLQ